MVKVVLEWKRFQSFLKAREEFRDTPCIYAMTDAAERALRIGHARDLWVRYNGGYAYEIEAAMHGSGNLVFVAPAPEDDLQRRNIEAVLIYTLQPKYCVQNKLYPPLEKFEIEHHGDAPKSIG